MMIAVLPASLAADDTGAAILRSNGSVLVKGSATPATATLFSGDTVEVQQNSSAQIDVSGSRVDIGAETLLDFQGDEIHLDHGTVSVNTSRGFRVRVGCLIITPAITDDWTRYDVTDINGKVRVSALKSDVNIDSRGGNARALKTGNSGRVSVREGEQKNREEKCGGADVKEGIAADGALLNSPYVKVAAGVIAAGTLCLIFCFHDDPLSPSNPSDKGKP
jgi:ferric-dicitrate binding protein FerR (iron transport regulator)